MPASHCVDSSIYLRAIRRVDGVVDIGCVPPELFQHLAGFDAVDPCQAIIGGAENMRPVPREAGRGDSFSVSPLIPPKALPTPHLPDLEKTASSVECIPSPGLSTERGSAWHGMHPTRLRCTAECCKQPSEQCKLCQWMWSINPTHQILRL